MDISPQDYRFSLTASDVYLDDNDDALVLACFIRDELNMNVDFL